MRKVAVIEFSGNWEEETITECLSLMGQFEFDSNQGMAVMTLTDGGAEKVLKAIAQKEVEE